MAETVKFTSGTTVSTSASSTMVAMPAGSYEYTTTVGSHAAAFILTGSATDTALDIADLAAIRFCSILADQNLVIQIGATDAAEIYVPAGHQQIMLWRSDVTHVYLTNLSATAANVKVAFGK